MKNMESNLCDANHSDSNVLLPPRKRLLAGFKKQNFYPNSDYPSTSNNKGVFNTQMNIFLKNPNSSLEEIVEQSSKAAEEAVKVAVAARAVAEEKAVAAAKAMVGAKSALELVADISDEVYNRDRHLKKNKMKKHLPVKTFYNKYGNVENCKKDEELALKLHHAMNSSPRITKISTDSNTKTNKHKRVKYLAIVEGSRVTSNGHGESEDETDSEDLIGERQVVGNYGNTSKLNGNYSLNIVNGEGKSSHSKEKSSELLDEFSRDSRKRVRMKQKKLPLSICSIRDLANTNEEMRSNGSLLNDESIGKNNTSMWKCKAFKGPVCVKQNKVTEP